MSFSTRSTLRVHQLALTLVLAAVSCASPFAPSSGTVRAIVRDQVNVPIAGVGVTISNQTGSGGAFTVSSSTRADGTITLFGIQPGNRMVTVTPPAGYSAGSDPLSKAVTVEADRTSEVTFALTRVTVSHDWAPR